MSGSDVRDINTMPGEADECTGYASEAQALLALEHSEQERRKRHEREHDLAETGSELDERVVEESECRAEAERPVQERTDGGFSRRDGETERRHDSHQQRCREREAQTGSPQGLELAVAEANGDCISSCEKGARQKGGENHPSVVGVHGATLRRCSSSA